MKLLLINIFVLLFLFSCKESEVVSQVNLNRNRDTVCPTMPTPTDGDSSVTSLSKWLRSAAHHDRGVNTLSVSDEITNGLNSSYRKIPDVALDDESIVANSNSYVECGLSGTLQERRDDCESKNSNNIIRADQLGNQSEDVWILVYYNQVSGLQAWFDRITGQVWSSSIGVNSWCEASGNTQNIAGIDCASAAFAQGSCDFISQELGGEFRLPTRSDFMRAEVDGIRYVFNISSQHLWSATASSQNKAKAWVFKGSDGSFETVDRLVPSQFVSCTGGF